jgi:hypothetical protein
MPAGTTIKHKRKAGAFVAGELAQAEQGFDITNDRWYYSPNGTTITAHPSASSTVASDFSGYTAKTTPADADTIVVNDSAASGALKKVTWANVKATLKTYFDTLYQAASAALSGIAGLSPSNDDFLQRKAGAWVNRTPAQVKTDLSLSGTNTGDQASIAGITGTTAQFNTALTDNDFATLAGVETLTNKTLTTPAVASFANANHTHQNSAGGGTLDAAAVGAGTLAAARMPALTGDATTSAGSVATTVTKINGVDQTTAWTAYTPTVTAFGGTLTTASAQGRYKQRGKSLELRVAVTITTNGTGSSAIVFTLPFATPNNEDQFIGGLETALSGKALRGHVPKNTSNCLVQFYDASYPGADGAVLVLTGVYESV